MPAPPGSPVGPSSRDPHEAGIRRLLPLRPVEFQILLSLSAGARHGYGVIRDAEERTGGQVRIDVATLYRALRRMEGEGMVAETAKRPVEDDDERRRYYELTPLGRAAAEAEARRLASLVRAARVAELLEGVEPA